ncbi:MAG: NAD(+)/NADH kinase, partial [Bacteroidales bacterium]|nr:NAD(+)/NADH kinase [Bacteroidales bacterium]
MNIGYFILNESLREDSRIQDFLRDLENNSFNLYEIKSKADVQPSTDLVLSIGGDGTFLSAAHVVADIGLPILGVNFGRIGFLCENRPEDVRRALLEGNFQIEYRTVLNTTLKGPDARRTIGMLPYSVNEVSIHRSGSSVLGIHVSINGETLPTYW